MTTDEIRKKFLDFFASKGHTIVASDSLVPKEDPTVLFTTAGMQQFKRQFLGNIDTYSRGASSQKCLRTDDLTQVGKTAFHHTFFEMLGNFSFGDYFKKDAICWAWEFLTQELRLPKKKLWVSVYKEDKEAEEIWLKDIKIPGDRLVKLGDKSNFWPAEAKAKGPNGPCGPCSEIFYDYGINPDCKNKNCNPDCDCGRFSEIWNLVFTQFNRKEDGTLEPLPGKNIDTGMGLERLSAVVQGKRNNFDIDIFIPIREAIDELIEGDTVKIAPQQKLVIADHIRAIVFAINDGVIPSNKERGSVVKRLITDSTNIVLSSGGQGASIHKLVTAVVVAMKTPYPELRNRTRDIIPLVKKTEEAFIRVRKQRIPELKKLDLSQLTSEQRGEVYFKFHDTYGLPLSTIVHTAGQSGLTEQESAADIKHYQEHMEEQKRRSRSSSKMAGNVFTDTDLILDVPKTKFTGYEKTSGQCKIIKLLKNNQDTKQVSQGDRVKVILDETPFYAEAGGQIGDTGDIILNNARINILGTQKTDDIFIHIGNVTDGTLSVNDTVTARVNKERRLSIVRSHTATHLLQAALRNILGPQVQQQGSLVAEDRLRFDFTYPQAVTKEKIHEIEDFVNEHIMANDKVTKEVMSIEEARKVGALAFFAEKYGDTVRIVSIKSYSKEFCGGTHLESLGQIGPFKITRESSIAQGIRRIEAETGRGALAFTNQQEQQLRQETANRNKAEAKKIKQKEQDKYQFESIQDTLSDIINKANVIKSTTVVTQTFDNVGIEILRKVSDLIKQKVKSSVIILGSRSCGDAYILVAVTDNLVKEGIKADEIIQEIAPIINGSGGGRPQLAQAGSKQTENVEKAIQQAEVLIKEKLK